jgi:flagellar biogenesis protein FliO
MGFSVVRVFGSLVVVLALFLGAVWLFKNWQRVAIYKGRTPKLNVLEIKSLGNRHALYLVGYEDQRFLIASSPAGVNLLTHLPEADGEPVAAVPVPTFAQSLRQTLAPKS